MATTEESDKVRWYVCSEKCVIKIQIIKNLEFSPVMFLFQTNPLPGKSQTLPKTPSWKTNFKTRNKRNSARMINGKISDTACSQKVTKGAQNRHINSANLDINDKQKLILEGLSEILLIYNSSWNLLFYFRSLCIRETFESIWMFWRHWKRTKTYRNF